jgi:alkanesulfonate monooxygenase SsuD/methylene tetrahydromethanopterin reductase-like flavin-dependent oxidoreductase (luciferase family)
MRFSIWPSAAQSWDGIIELAAHCEQTGWDGVYIADHFMPNSPGTEPLDGDMLECWSVLAALAALVPRVRLGSLVSSVTYRHPAVLANIAAATDHISAGRLTLGVGAGWQLNEHAAYGIQLGSVRERLDRFDEAVQILHSLLSEPRTTFEGRFFQLQDAPNQPGPVRGRLPLLIGGGGEQRTMRTAARYADHWNCCQRPTCSRTKSRCCARTARRSAGTRRTFMSPLRRCSTFRATRTGWTSADSSWRGGTRWSSVRPRR